MCHAILPTAIEQDVKPPTHTLHRLLTHRPTTQLKKITDHILRAWPFGQSTREVGFLQLLGSVLASAPLLYHIDDRTRLPLRAFARVAACLRSPHAGVAEEALLTCTNPRLISLYVGTNAPGAGPTGTEVPGMVKAALAQNAQGHWNGDVREESGRLLSMLVAADAAAAVMESVGTRYGKGKKQGGGTNGVVAAVGGGGRRCRGVSWSSCETAVLKGVME